MRLLLTVCSAAVLMMVLSLSCFAQDASEKASSADGKAPKVSTDGKAAAKAGGEKEGEESGDAVKSSEPAFKLEGDVVVLKTGKEIRGVKVLRVTPNMVEIEYIPGQPAMKVLRKQVDHIEYAKPSTPSTPVVGATDEKAKDVMLGEKLETEFHRNLTTPIPGTPLKYENQDVVTVLQELADKVKVNFTVDPKVNRLTEDQRRVSVEVPKEATLMAFLQKELVEALPILRVTYQFDKLVLVPATEENKPASPESPAAPAAPAPAQ